MTTLLIVAVCLAIGGVAGRAYEVGARASREHPMWAARARLAAEFGTPSNSPEWHRELGPALTVIEGGRT